MASDIARQERLLASRENMQSILVRVVTGRELGKLPKNTYSPARIRDDISNDGTDSKKLNSLRVPRTESESCGLNVRMRRLLTERDQAG